MKGEGGLDGMTVFPVHPSASPPDVADVESIDSIFPPPRPSVAVILKLLFGYIQTRGEG